MAASIRRRTARRRAPRLAARWTAWALVLTLVSLWLSTIGCARDDSVDLLNLVDVAPRDVEVGDTIEVLGSGLPSGSGHHAVVMFEGSLHRPGQAPSELSANCTPTSSCIHVSGAKLAPDKVSFIFTEGLQSQFCGGGEKAAHTTFHGNVIVQLPSGVPDGHAVRGKVMGITLDFRPPTVRRLVMRARVDEGEKALNYLGITLAAGVAPAGGGLRVAKVKPQSPADRAGLMAGDVIHTFGDLTATSVADLVPATGAALVNVSITRGSSEPMTRQIATADFEPSALSGEMLAALIILLITVVVLLVFMAPTAGIITWFERRVSGRMQSRIGPNRAGPQGFFIWVADGIKSIMKEDIIPTAADEPLFRLAPYLVFVGVSATFVVMPFGQYLIAANLDIGILFVVAVTSLVAIGLMTGGWASNNKWSMLGGIRAAAQIVSYEVPAAIAIVCVVMMTGSLRMQDIIGAQGAIDGAWYSVGGWPWHWFIFRNPVTLLLFFLYFTTALAEGNRAPFDMPEAESELVAGYSTEYSGMRYVFFFFAEWANVFVMSGIAAALFLGGWQIPGVSAAAQEASLWLQLGGTVLFLVKAWILIFVVVWLRWTLPRVRIDQLMSLCWKWFVPLAFAAFLLTGLWVLGTSQTPRMGADGLPEATAPFIPASLQTITAVAMFGVFVLLLAHFFRRVWYNFKRSRQPLHLNPFL